MDGLKSTSRKREEKGKGVKLYLRVHVMPKLNMPLKGKPWQWIAPLVFLAIIVVLAVVYYFS